MEFKDYETTIKSICFVGFATFIQALPAALLTAVGAKRQKHIVTTRFEGAGKL